MKKKYSSFLSSWKNPWRVFTFLTVFLFLLFFPGTGYYETLQLVEKPPLVRAVDFEIPPVSLYPQKMGVEPIPPLTAEAVVIKDLDSAVTMLALNPEEKLRPASITKLMTALVALDYYDLNQVLAVKRLAPVDRNEPESEMGLAVGDQVSVKNLLYGLLVPSGNDAAYTLADNYSGGIENFLYAMNQKAKELHMENTHFDNPVGIDSPGQFTTANDLALLTAAALRINLISQIVATSGISLADAAGKKVYVVKNVNQLLGNVYGVDGVKTGFTDDAGQCVVTSVSRDGHRIIIVLLKSQERFAETAALINWVFRNFQWVSVKS